MINIKIIPVINEAGWFYACKEKRTFRPARYILESYDDVEEKSGLTFGDPQPFLLYRPPAKFSSVKKARKAIRRVLGTSAIINEHEC